MKPTKAQIAIILIGVVIALVFLLIFTGVLPGLRSNQQTSGLTGNITVWGVFDSQEVMEETLLAQFAAQNPGVSVTYRQIDDRTYEEDLVNALAAGNGPDVFMIHNTWVNNHQDKIRELSSVTPLDLTNWYPRVVSADFVRGNAVYALPLYIDSLALFYNRSILDNAGIATPPRTWDEFIALIPRLRKVDDLGRISQAAIALGGSEDNVNQATDIVSLFMLQDGVQMVDTDRGEATFSPEGASALSLYTSFANPRNTQYTWDPGFAYSLDAFVQEDLAMMFNYGYQRELLKSQNPFLDFDVAPMPQKSLDGDQVNYADYWGFAVAKRSSQPGVAEAFVRFTGTDEAASVAYLNATKRAPALRSVIARTTDDASIGVFSTQALTATSWPIPDLAVTEQLFTIMINDIITGRRTVARALQQAETAVTALIPSPAR